MFKRILNRFRYAFGGIWYALRHDNSYQVEFIFGPVILAFFCFVFWPVAPIELLFLTLAYFIVLITELQNSAFEAALDRLHPELHDEIGRSKDMAAGAVLTAGIFLLLVMGVIAFF